MPTLLELEKFLEVLAGGDNPSDRDFLQFSTKGWRFSSALGGPRFPRYTDTTRPDPGIPGRLIYNDTDGTINVDDGTNWILPGAGSPGSLDDLTDVTLTAPSTGEVLQKSAGDWVNATLNFGDISGQVSDAQVPSSAVSQHGDSITIGNDLAGSLSTAQVVGIRGIEIQAVIPGDGEVWAYNQGNNRYEPSAVATILDALSDVDAPTPGDEQFLVFNSGTGNWRPKGITDSDLPVHDINSLHDGFPLTVQNGGTGLTGVTIGSILYAPSNGTLAELTIGTGSKFLFSDGSAPSWQQPTFSDLGGTIANGQVPSSAVTQYEGNLSINANQIPDPTDLGVLRINAGEPPSGIAGRLLLDLTAGQLKYDDGITWLDLVQEADVTQHEAALVIQESQIPDAGILTRRLDNEIITGTWSFNNILSVLGTGTSNFGRLKGGTAGFALRNSANSINLLLWTESTGNLDLDPAGSISGDVRIGTSRVLTLSDNPVLDGDAAGGDLSGTYPNPAVNRILGDPNQAFGGQIPSDGFIFRYVGTYGVDGDWDAIAPPFLAENEPATISGQWDFTTGPDFQDLVTLTAAGPEVARVGGTGTQERYIGFSSGAVQFGHGLSGGDTTFIRTDVGFVIRTDTTKTAFSIAPSTANITVFNDFQAGGDIFANTSDAVLTDATPAGGDLSGTYPNPTVVKLQGRAVEAAAPGALEFLRWNGGQNEWQAVRDHFRGALTADPSSGSLVDGDHWVRTDNDEFRWRSGGSTFSITGFDQGP